MLIIWIFPKFIVSLLQKVKGSGIRPIIESQNYRKKTIMETRDLLKRVSDNLLLKDKDIIIDNKGKSIFFIGGEDVLRHFFNFLYLNNIKINAIDDEIGRMLNAFSMTISIIVYGKSDITIEDIVNDKYLKGDLYQTDKQEEIAKYLLENIEKIEQNAYTDCEGLTYSKFSFKTI